MPAVTWKGLEVAPDSKSYAALSADSMSVMAVELGLVLLEPSATASEISAVVVGSVPDAAFVGVPDKVNSPSVRVKNEFEVIEVSKEDEDGCVTVIVGTLLPVSVMLNVEFGLEVTLNPLPDVNALSAA